MFYNLIDVLWKTKFLKFTDCSDFFFAEPKLFHGQNFIIPEKKVLLVWKNFFLKFFYVPEFLGFQTTDYWSEKYSSF